MSITRFPIFPHRRASSPPRAAMLIITAACSILAGCEATTPSKRVGAALNLPAPTSHKTLPKSERLLNTDQRGPLQLTPVTLVRTAFDGNPNIKSSFRRFKSEEARYDFFYASNDSLTPQLSVGSRYNEFEDRAGNDGWGYVDRLRTHTATVGVEKRFFDTTRMELDVGYDWSDLDGEGYGGKPFAAAQIRYPLWASRERLERTSEDIFRRNELNDARLNFIKSVRVQLRSALNHYFSTIYNMKQREASTSRRQDLEALLQRLQSLDTPEAAADARRVEAEITSVRSQEEGFETFVNVFFARVNGALGLPFNTPLNVIEEEFNPFIGATHRELLERAIDTDPEIGALRNARDNAHAQLELAQKGKWDVALLFGGKTDLRGDGQATDETEWEVSFGLEVAAVDARVTGSLIRQARADIERYNEAIAARENAIYVNTLEPVARNIQLRETRQDLIDALPDYISDYQDGVQAYFARKININDLIQRRADLYSQEVEIARQAFYMGVNVSSLCAETGLFFELLNGTEQEAMEVLQNHHAQWNGENPETEHAADRLEDTGA